MKRIMISAAMTLCAVLFQVSVQCADVSARPMNWYCVHVHDGTQPQCDPEMEFIGQYGGYYIDKNNSDPCAAEKVIYLTFDAGYENGNIEKILDVMKAEGVTGAFFILENLVNKEPDLVRRMADEGHLVCNHTASHKDMTKYRTKESFLAELSRMEELCLEKTGVTMAKYYRPPEGRFSEENMLFASEAGYKTVFWSFGYVDWDNAHQMQPEDALDKIMSGIHNGEVLLLHPTSATNAEIMGDLIRQLRSKGFRFGTLDELTE